MINEETMIKGIDCLRVHELWVGGMTIKDIAELCGVHRDTIKNKIREAEKLLAPKEGEGTEEVELPFK